MPEIAMVIDAKTKQWTGEIPKGVRQVCMQFLMTKEERLRAIEKYGEEVVNVLGGWWPPPEKAMPRNVKESIEYMQKTVARGPNKHEKYRLVPTPSSSRNLKPSEEEDMAAKKKAAKKGKVTTRKVQPRDTSNLLMGKFRPDSVGGRMVELLSDGKPRSAAEIAKVVKPKSVENITSSGGWYSLLKQFGEKSDFFDMAKTEDGKIQMTLSAAGKKAIKTNSHTANGGDTSVATNGGVAKKKARKAGKKKRATTAPPEDAAADDVSVEA